MDPAASPAQARHHMVDGLRREGVTDPLVLAAMDTVERERFVPPGLAALAYEDRPLPIGDDATISAPSVVARMTAALALTGAEHVLEVGTGSGYAAAVLAACARSVVSVEWSATLVRAARDALAAAGVDAVEVRHGDGADGAPDRAPFDAVSVTAMAPAPPPALFDQLTVDGVLVAPVGPDREGVLVRYRHGRREDLGPVRFVALRRAGSG